MFADRRFLMSGSSTYFGHLQVRKKCLKCQTVDISANRDASGLGLHDCRLHPRFAFGVTEESRIKRTSQRLIWVVGTSMGTISAAAAAIHDSENFVSGVVLTSSIVAYKFPGAVPKQNLDKVRMPTLVLHHEDDACWACRPYEIKAICILRWESSQSPVLEFVLFCAKRG
jgi:hypothetical protein